jgi:acetyl esterase/lipase
VTTPAAPGLTRPDTDPLPDPVPLKGDIGWVRRAVEYSAPVGHRPLLLDLYTPDGTPPVVVFVHGGGWRLGTRRVFCPTWRDWDPDPFHRLVAAGFAVASIDYRLSGEAVFPAQLHDAQAGLRWLGIRADELGRREPGRRLGESAGAHHAALLGLTAGGAVVGVVDWYGPADLGTMQYQALPNAVAQPDAPDSRESS